MSITAMRQALEALEFANVNHWWGSSNIEKAITSLRQALEQADAVTLTQTNVGIGERAMEAYEAAKQRGWSGVSDERLMEMPKQEPVIDKSAAIRIATALGWEPKREPLTDEQIMQAAGDTLDVYSCARAIEAAHGIKGEA